MAFRTLKVKLTESPILAYPKAEGGLILDTDACDLGIGAVLSKVQSGVEKVLARCERNYCVTRTVHPD